MAKVAVSLQERMEQLPAGTQANVDDSTLIVTQLQGCLVELDEVEAKLNRAKLTLKASTQAHDDRLKFVQAAITKAELAAKSHYGPKSPKVKEYVMAQPRARRPSPKV